MKKLQIFILLILAVLAIAFGAYYISNADNKADNINKDITQQNVGGDVRTEKIAYPDYNPNYSNAILNNNPELCSDIKYALEGQPTDSVINIYGDEAKELCVKQAEEGTIECECPADIILQEMLDQNPTK